jgi:integrase
LKLTGLSPARLQRFYRAKLDAGLSPRTVQYMHATLHRALDRATKWGLVPRNVTEAVDAPRPARREIQPLSPEQARRLLSEARGDRFEALYVLALTTGLRQGELLGLRWEDVDLDSGRLHVRRTLITGGKLTFGQPKTARGRRSVALAPQTADSLKAHCDRQRAAGLYAGDGLVFCTRAGTPIAPQNLVRRYFKPLLKWAGLPDIRFHDLRHTCATLLLGRDVHPRIVQDLLGHAQITLTLDTYSHVLPDMQAGAADAMRDVLEDDDK